MKNTPILLFVALAASAAVAAAPPATSPATQPAPIVLAAGKDYVVHWLKQDGLIVCTHVPTLAPRVLFAGRTWVEPSTATATLGLTGVGTTSAGASYITGTPSSVATPTWLTSGLGTIGVGTGPFVITGIGSTTGSSSAVTGTLSSVAVPTWSTISSGAVTVAAGTGGLVSAPAALVRYSQMRSESIAAACADGERLYVLTHTHSQPLDPSPLVGIDGDGYRLRVIWLADFSPIAFGNGSDIAVYERPGERPESMLATIPGGVRCMGNGFRFEGRRLVGQEPATKPTTTP